MNRLKVSIIFNFIITIFVVIATVFMMNGVFFMGEEKQLTETGIGLFKFFTVQSNVIMGFAAFIFMMYEILLITNRIKEIPTWLYILKHVFTVGVVLTFFTTILYLAPRVEDGYFSLFKNSNLFYHFIVPVLSWITFVFFEKTDKIKFKYIFAGVVPMLLYGIFYTINVFMHTDNEKIIPRYDWYGFVEGGVSSILISFPIMLVTTVFISFSLWKSNKK